MHGYDLILTLTGGLSAALVLGYITQRLGLSPIVGYLLAGVLVGPHTPGFVADASLSEQLAEIGVILLMFGVGLQFHLDELLAVRGVAVPGAIVQSGAATVLGALLARSLGWEWSAGVIFGIALSVASTVVLIRVLADNNDLHTQPGHIAVGWLVVEDLFTVLALVLLPALFGADHAETPLWLALIATGAKVAALVAFAALVGTRVIPRVLDYVADTRSRELFTLTVLVIALGIAVGSSQIFNVSMALGAFLAGMVVGRSDYSLRAAAEALPMRDAFAVLFFVSIGMLLDPAALSTSPALLAGALAIVLVAKPIVALILVWALRYPFRTSLTVGVALAQIGEFSFILSSLGRELGILTTEATNVLVATSIASIVLNPIGYRTIRPIGRWVSERPRLAAFLNRAASVPSDLLPVGAPRATDPSAPGRDHRLRAHWPDRRPAAAGQRGHSHGDRAQHRYRARAAAGGHQCGVRRRDSSGDTRFRWSGARGQPHPHVRRHGPERRRDPPGPRAQPEDSRARAGHLSPRRRHAEAGRRQPGVFR